MADFQTSTHRSKWIFTPFDLVEKYEVVNQRATKTLAQYGSTGMKIDVDGSLSYPEQQLNVKDNAGKHSSPRALNIEEEQLMRVFYEQKIQEVCGAFQFPHKIQATAIIYFKRFYLQWSVMEHHPKNIMLTCIYTACKIEENHVSAEELGKGIHQDHQMILNNEMIVLQSLGFDLIVYAPYRALEGFINDVEDFSQVQDEQLQMLKDLHGSAKFEVDKIMLTDAPLLFPPGQLALAALRGANEVLQVVDFHSYLSSILSRQRASHTISEFLESLTAIDISVRKLKVPTAKDMKHIDRKLKSCLDPSSQSHDDSKKREKRSKHKSKRSSNEMPNESSGHALRFLLLLRSLLVRRATMRYPLFTYSRRKQQPITPQMLATTSSKAPINMHELPTALKKGICSCTQHPIFEFVSYALLTPSSEVFIASLYSIYISKQWQEALKLTEWNEAMVEEMNALEKNYAWNMVDLRPRKKKGCRWVFTMK